MPQNGRISEDDIDQDDNDDDQQEDYDSESDMLAALLKIQQGKASTSNGKKKNHRKADSKPISPKEVFRDSTEGPEDHTTISTPTTGEKLYEILPPLLQSFSGQRQAKHLSWSLTSFDSALTPFYSAQLSVLHDLTQLE